MWYRMTATQVAKELEVDPTQGLTTGEAKARLQKYGPNILVSEKKGPTLSAWTRSYRHFIIGALLAATLLTLFFSANLGVSLLLASLTLCSVLFGFYEDFRKDFTSFDKNANARVYVRRDNELIEIDAKLLVPGDIVMMTTGNRVPADGRLYVAARLNIDEAALTGRNVPTWKEIEAIDKARARLGDRINMAYMNTTILRGYGVMIVTATGMNTEFGRMICLSNQTTREQKALPKHSHHPTLDFVSRMLPLKL
jgi:Ca2+-transporting ATPase